MRDDGPNPGDWVLQVRPDTDDWKAREEAAYLAGTATSPYLTRAVRLIEMTPAHIVIFDPFNWTPSVLVRADYPEWRLASAPVVAASLTLALRRMYASTISADRIRINSLKLDEIVRRLVAGRSDWDEVTTAPEAEPAGAVGSPAKPLTLHNFGSGSGGSV